MSKAAVIAILAVLTVPACFAQDAPTPAPKKATVICVADLSGLEAKNWKLREPLERDLVNKSAEKKINTKIVLLAAHDEKHGRAEGASKSCDIAVYSTVDRVVKAFQVSMNPSSYGRESANPNGPHQASTVIYNIKIVNAMGKKLMSDHADIDLLPESTPSDYNSAGKKLVDTVAEKILSTVPNE